MGDDGASGCFYRDRGAAAIRIIVKGTRPATTADVYVAAPYPISSWPATLES